MRRKLFTAMSIVAVLVISVAAQQSSLTPKALAGRWEGQHPAEDRVNVIVLNLRVWGATVAGSVDYNGQTFGDITSPSMTDDVLNFAVNDLVCRGVVKGDSMTLTISTAEKELWSVVLTRKP